MVTFVGFDPSRDIFHSLIWKHLVAHELQFECVQFTVKFHVPLFYNGILILNRYSFILSNTLFAQWGYSNRYINFVMKMT